jgi:hypothetical protein
MADARLDERLRFGRRTPADAARYRRSIHLAFAMIAAIYVIAVIAGPAGQAAGAGGVYWLLPWVLGVLLVRITAHLTIQIHEYVHCVGPERADLLIRVFPAMIGPLTGYREVHLLHTAHHEHLLGREDPDLGVMVGRPVWSYLRIFFYHEYFFIHYLRHEGQLAGPGHVVELAGRALIFTAAALWVPGWTLLLLLLSTRVAFSTAYFLLSWYLHREGPCVGTYRKPMPAWLAAVVWALGGRPALATLRYHDLHHRFPELDVGALERVARVVPFDRAAATVFVLGPCPHLEDCARCGDAQGFQARSIQSSGA